MSDIHPALKAALDNPDTDIRVWYPLLEKYPPTFEALDYAFTKECWDSYYYIYTKLNDGTLDKNLPRLQQHLNAMLLNSYAWHAINSTLAGQTYMGSKLTFTTAQLNRLIVTACRFNPTSNEAEAASEIIMGSAVPPLTEVDTSPIVATRNWSMLHSAYLNGATPHPELAEEILATSLESDENWHLLKYMAKAGHVYSTDIMESFLVRGIQFDSGYDTVIEMMKAGTPIRDYFLDMIELEPYSIGYGAECKFAMLRVLAGKPIPAFPQGYTNDTSTDQERFDEAFFNYHFYTAYLYLAATDVVVQPEYLKLVPTFKKDSLTFLGVLSAKLQGKVCRLPPHHLETLLEAAKERRTDFYANNPDKIPERLLPAT